MQAMSDPFSVLGVSPSASGDEIKAAYRRLAQKYHPDLNPGDAKAAQRMKDINAAYDQIKNPGSAQQSDAGDRYEGGYGASYADPFGFGGFGGFGGYRQKTGASNESKAARHYIEAGHFDEALHVLSTVPSGDRNAEWFYLSAIANYNVGNRISALQHAQTAVRMEPGNYEYAQLLKSMEYGGEVYRRTSRAPVFNSDMGKLVIGLCAAQFLCRFCAFC
jgi:molecular chaperone DnaJ